MRLLPNIVLGALVGDLIDRFSARRIAIYGAVASAAIVAVVPFTCDAFLFAGTAIGGVMALQNLRWTGFAVCVAMAAPVLFVAGSLIRRPKAH